MTSIQVTTIGGVIIDRARWEVPSLDSVQAGHALAICLPSDDKSLLAHIRKQSKIECAIDRSEDGKNSIIITLLVKQVRHMLELNPSKFDTMCIAVPTSRFAELVVLYMLDPTKCDRRFVEAVRQS
jgi:hypothetical protein